MLARSRSEEARPRDRASLAAVRPPVRHRRSSLPPRLPPLVPSATFLSKPSPLYRDSPRASSGPTFWGRMVADLHYNPDDQHGMPTSALGVLSAQTRSTSYNDTNYHVLRRLLAERTRLGTYGSRRATHSSGTFSFCPFFLPCVVSCDVGFLPPPSLIHCIPGRCHL